jgi:hypothetical protein
MALSYKARRRWALVILLIGVRDLRGFGRALGLSVQESLYGCRSSRPRCTAGLRARQTQKRRPQAEGRR